MRGLDPRIHQSSQRVFAKRMDRRVKPRRCQLEREKLGGRGQFGETRGLDIY